MAQRLPNFGNLQAFDAAGRHLSFQGAARELNVTPAAISHRIRELEREIGVELFRRFNRRVALTDAGEELLARTTLAFRELRQGLQAATDRKDRPLRISVAPSFATRWLVPRLPAFLDRHPNIRLEVTASRAVEDLAGDGFDMAIRFGPGAYEGLHAELLAKADVRPVCAPSLARRLRSPADLDPRLLMHDAYPFGASGVPGWREWLAAAGLGKATSTGMHFDTTHLLLEAALEGQGVALGLNLLIEDDLRTGRLVCPFGPVLPVEKWAFHFVCTRASLSRPSVRSVRNWLRTELDHSSAAEPDLTE